jgi:hypothetical protein
MPRMHHPEQPPVDPSRRNLFATLPALLLAPAAMAQQGLADPQKPQKVASTAQRDVPILPFALAGAWSDDFGARDQLKMSLDLNGTILFSGQTPPYEEDQRRRLLVQVGAAVECVSTLASTSSCSFQTLAPRKSDPWLLKASVRVSAKGGPATARAVAVSSGIWSRPLASGAFDPAWKDKALVDRIAGSMNEFGVSIKVVKDESMKECIAALQAIAKASPVLASSIGPASNWGDHMGIVLVGIASQDAAQGFLASGQSLQRGSLQAFAEGVNGDVFVLPSRALEAAAVASKDAAIAVKNLVKLFDGEAEELLGVARIGKLAAPAFRPMPACVPMISFPWAAE